MSHTQDIYISEYVNVVTITQTFISALFSRCMLHSSNHHIRPLSKKLKQWLPTYITELKNLLICICVYYKAECSYYVMLWASMCTAQGQALDLSINQG
jgi:hypothetical protein